MTDVVTVANHELPKCGRPKRQGDRGPCQLPAGHGTDHPGDGPCGLHGGHLPVVRKASHRRLAEASYRHYLHEQGVEEGDDNAARIRSLIADADAWLRFVRDKVASVDIDEWEKIGDKGGVRLTVYVELMERAMDRVERFVLDAERLGLYKREVRIAEDQGAQLVDVLRDVLAQAFALLMDRAAQEPLTPEVLAQVQREQVPAVVRHRLAELVEVNP